MRNHVFGIIAAVACACLQPSVVAADECPTNNVIISSGIKVAPQTVAKIEKALKAVSANNGRHFMVAVIKGGDGETQAQSLFDKWGWVEKNEKCRGMYNTCVMACFVFPDSRQIVIKSTPDMAQMVDMNLVSSTIRKGVSAAPTDYEALLVNASASMVCAACPGYTRDAFLETKQVFQLKNMAIFAIWSMLVAIFAASFKRKVLDPCSCTPRKKNSCQWGKGCR